MLKKEDKLSISSLCRENEQKQISDFNLIDFNSFIQKMHVLNVENSQNLMFLINKSIELRILETNKELNSWSCLIESKDSLNLFK